MFKINKNIEEVWEFYTYIDHLIIITPKYLNLKLLNTSSKKFFHGTQFRIQGKILFFTSEWHSIITSIRLYEYVDEIISGPFKRWSLAHKFHYNVKLNQTEVIDEIEFELPYGVDKTMARQYTTDG
jgi:ligand-binding SRPBCC domain-containing protein